MCEDFAEAIDDSAARTPAPSSCSSSRDPRRTPPACARAAKNRQCYFDTKLRITVLPWSPSSGPRRIEDFLTWVDLHPGKLGHPSPIDDGVLGRWCALTKQTSVSPSPPSCSTDEAVSTIGRSNAWGRTGPIAEMFEEVVDGYEW